MDDTKIATENEFSDNSANALFTVTPLSKYLALLLFIALPFIGGWVGYTYAPTKILEVEKIVFHEKVEAEVVADTSFNEETADAGIVLTNLVRTGAYTVYGVENGYITGEWEVDYGPNNHGGSAIYFRPFNKTPEMANKFLIANDTASTTRIFGISLSELDGLNETCTLSGGIATIFISEYAVLEAEIGATDYAAYEEALFFKDATSKTCW